MALPDYLQEAGKDFAKQLTAQTAVPIDTTKFTGRDFVAREDPLQTQAINLATQGIGSFQPFLTSAQEAIKQAGQDVGGLQQFMGSGMPTPQGVTPGSIADFQSPYQQAVIDESLRQFEDSRKAGLQQIADSAAQFGAFGGGRQGALEGQFMADTALGRAGLEAQLRAQGFADAAARRGQAFGQQQSLANQRAGLAQNQFALSNFQQAGRAADVANLGQLGAFRQGLDQSRLQADATAAQTAAFEPLQRLQQYGSGLAGLSGFASPTPLPAAAPSPFSTALSTALGIGGLFGKFR